MRIASPLAVQSIYRPPTAKMAVYLGARVWLADIVAVRCLNDRVRPLLKCPRAHEGNFQSLYYRGGELACRHCHELRYRSNLAATPSERSRLFRRKLLGRIGNDGADETPKRLRGKWRKCYKKMLMPWEELSNLHYGNLRFQLGKPE